MNHRRSKGGLHKYSKLFDRESLTVKEESIVVKREHELCPLCLAEDDFEPTYDNFLDDT